MTDILADNKYLKLKWGYVEQHLDLRLNRFNIKIIRKFWDKLESNEISWAQRQVEI